MSQISQASEFFATNRRTDQLADNLPDACRPRDLATAYRIQTALVVQMLKEHGGRTAGYKIACTNVSAQKQLNINAPLFGRLLTAFIHDHPAKLTASDFHVRIIEPEYAFAMRADVPDSAQPYTRESIAPLVGAVIPSLEVVNHHFTDWTQVGGFTLAADNAIHGAWVPGVAVTDWQSLDLESETVSLSVGGNVVETGSGENVLGHPLSVLAWLANELPRFGQRLREGDRVTTGTTTTVYAAEAGDSIEAEFGALGKVQLKFV